MHKKCSEIRPWLALGRPRAAMAQQTSWGTTRCGGSPCLPCLISISKHSWVQAESSRQSSFIKFPNYPEFRWFSYAIWHTIAHTSASSISSIPCFFSVSWFLMVSAKRSSSNSGLPWPPRLHPRGLKPSAVQWRLQLPFSDVGSCCLAGRRGVMTYHNTPSHKSCGCYNLHLDYLLFNYIEEQ